MLLIAPDSGDILDANPAAAAFYGWPRERLTGMAIQEINTLTQAQVAEERLLAAQDGRRFFRFRHRLADGTTRPVEVHSLAIKLGSERPLLSIVRDLAPGECRPEAERHFQERLEAQVEAQVRDLDLAHTRLAWGLAGALAAQALVIAWLVSNIRRRRRLEREHQGVEAALREREERLQLAIRGGDLGLWDWDVPSGRVVFDDRWATALGYDPAEIAPNLESWSRLVHPDDWPAIHAALDPHLRGATAEYECEVRLRHRDGHWVWVLDRGRVVERGPDGAALRVAGTHLDISTRMEAEARHREGLANLERFVDQAPVAMAMLDRDLRYLAASGRWKDDFGLAGRDLTGLSHYDVFPDLPERWREVHRRVLGGETCRAEEDQFLRADGTEYWLRWDERPWRDPQGAVGGVLIYSEDITGRKRAQIGLHASEEVNRVTFERAPVGMVHAAPDGRLLRVNARLCQMLGYGRDELVELTFQAITHPDDLAAGLALTRETLIGRREGFGVEKRYLRKDGTPLWASVTVSLIRDDRGEPSHFIAVIQDIGEAKAAEGRLRAQLAELRAWQQTMLEREERVMALKLEVNALLADQGRAARYPGPTGPGVAP
jgi:PAS domain S-box-containing protein